MCEGMCSPKKAGALDRGMQAPRISKSPVPEVVHYVRCCERRRRAGIFERGMQALRRNASSLIQPQAAVLCKLLCARSEGGGHS